jgi:hypothetical protein
MQIVLDKCYEISMFYWPGLNWWADYIARMEGVTVFCFYSFKGFVF